MPSARTFHQKRHYLIQLSAFVAAVFLVSNCAAQAKPGTRTAQQSKDPVLAQDLSAYPGLIPEFGQLFVKLQKNVQYPAPRTESRLLLRKLSSGYLTTLNCRRQLIALHFIRVRQPMDLTHGPAS